MLALTPKSKVNHWGMGDKFGMVRNRFDEFDISSFHILYIEVCNDVCSWYVSVGNLTS